MSNSRSKVPEELLKLGVRNMNITSLDLSHENLTNLPKEIGNLTNLTYLRLDNNNLKSIPPQIGNLTKLNSIFMQKNYLKTLPSQIGKLENLDHIDLSNNNLIKLPPQIGKLENLDHIDLSNNNLESLPPQIGNLKKLLVLSLGYNNLESLPPQIGNLEKLDFLFLNNNKLKSLPPSIGNLENLQILRLDNNNNLKLLPRSLIRSGLKITKNNSTKFEHIPIVRRNVPINKVPLNINNKRSDSITMENFKVGHNAIYLGYNKYLHEKTFLNWIKTQNNSTNITNINALYSRRPNDYIGVNPLTQKPLFRKNLNFVKFVKPNTPNTLAKKLNNTKINNKLKTQNLRNNIRKRAGNAAQSRRTNVNNNNK